MFVTPLLEFPLVVNHCRQLEEILTLVSVTGCQEPPFRFQIFLREERFEKVRLERRAALESLCSEC